MSAVTVTCVVESETVAVRCEKCGARVSSLAALPGHYRRAHGRVRRSIALVPVKPKPRPIRAEVLDVTPVRSEIVRLEREASLVGPILARSEPEPEWFARHFPQDARAVPWRKRDEENREYYRAQRAAMEGSIVSLARRPEETDAVALWEQFYFLKALAMRLDAGRGTERDRAMFEAGLREYNANFDRIAQWKALPG